MRALVWIDSAGIVRYWTSDGPRTSDHIPSDALDGGPAATSKNTTDDWFAVGWKIVTGNASGAESGHDLITLEKADPS